MRRGAKEITTAEMMVIRSGDILIVVCDEGIVGKMTEEMTHLVTAPRVLCNKWYTEKQRGDNDERTKK